LLKEEHDLQNQVFVIILSSSSRSLAFGNVNYHD